MGDEMGTKYGKTSFVAAAILILVNLFVMVFCLFVFAISIWVISSPQTLSLVISTIGNPTLKALLRPETIAVQSAVGIAFVSIILFSFAFMGLYGAIVKSQFLLFIYAVLVLLFLLLECALFFYFTTDIIEKGLHENDGDWGHAVRLAFRCCDINITNAVSDRVYKVQWSCCGIEGYPNNCTLEQIATKNCSHEISDWLYKYQTAIYTSLAALHIVLSSCSLLRRSRIQASLSDR